VEDTRAVASESARRERFRIADEYVLY